MLFLAQLLTYVVAIHAPTADPVVVPPIAVLATLSTADLNCGANLLPPASTVVPFVVTEGFRLQGTFDGKTCETPILSGEAIPVCVSAPCPTYAVYIKTGEAWSLAAIPLITTLPLVSPNAEACGLLGNRAVSIFITSVQETTGRPGSKSRVNYQLASPNSPIVALAVRVDGKNVSELLGEQLLDTAGIWFPVPTSGTHSLTLLATNAYGCSKEQLASTLVVQ